MGTGAGGTPSSLLSPPPRSAQPPLPTHTLLPRLKDHLFFQRLENDGQEWLSSESDIGAPPEPHVWTALSRRGRHRAQRSSVQV